MLRLPKLWLGVLVVIVLAGGFAVWRQRQPGVSVSLDPAFPALGHPNRTVGLVLRAPSGPLASFEVRVVQGDAARTVMSEALPAAAAQELERPLELNAPSLELKEGPAELHVYARDAVWRPWPTSRPQLVHPFTVDLTMPTLEFRASTRYVRHAGAGIVVYRAEGATRSGIQVASAFFPGVTGLATDPAVHVALFTIPYSEPEVQTPPSIVAEDEAGNQRVIALPVTILPGRFPKDSIRLSESFLRRKVPELAPQTPGTAPPATLLEAFLEVNGEGRQADEARIRKNTVGGSHAAPLWHGVFRQQRNSKVFANFPEERTYFVDEKIVDTQWHLGIDLASTRRSPVEASNAGRVVFAEANGIYGNTVILDHGLGLFTLYAHLSEIAVEVGDAVAQGDTLGRTGESGFAGGDHLHFAVLVNGVYTTPIEWWDERWIRDRIATPLTEGGITVTGITDGGDEPESAPRGTLPAAPPQR